MRRLVLLVLSGLLLGACGSPFSTLTPREPVTLHQVTGAHTPICFSGELPDPSGGECLQLAGSRLTVSELRELKVEQGDSGNGWVVRLTLTDPDARLFGDLTGELAGQQPPRNRLAIVLNGTDLIAAPMVVEAITGGQLQLSGSWTKAEAEALAQRLGG